MWKFPAFSNTQILLEINFVESRTKSAFFAILGSLKIDNLLNFSLSKMQMQGTEAHNTELIDLVIHLVEELLSIK